MCKEIWIEKQEIQMDNSQVIVHLIRWPDNMTPIYYFFYIVIVNKKKPITRSITLGKIKWAPATENHELYQCQMEINTKFPPTLWVTDNDYLQHITLYTNNENALAFTSPLNVVRIHLWMWFHWSDQMCLGHLHLAFIVVMCYPTVVWLLNMHIVMQAVKTVNEKDHIYIRNMICVYTIKSIL